MFSWATKQFEQITNTLAPPPDDATGRFLYCCQRDDEDGALACVPELPGAGVIVNAAKGQVPLHVACQSSMTKLVRELMSQPGASTDLRDSTGNTCLHAACTSQKPNALELVKVLVTEYHANVCDKNSQGETPYDVSLLNSIRQYLLPIQLQKETQEALDNGGVGLPPGIDLGGLRITNSALAPPPIGGAIPPPPISGGIGATAGPPVVPPLLSSSAPPMVVSPPGTHTHPYAPQQTPTAITTAAQPAMMSSPPPQLGISQADRAMSAPASSSSAIPTDGPGQGVPAAPASGGRHEYALTGHSSAAIYKPQGRRVIQPDGFHSSSSDKRLQQKYGHEQAGLHVPKAVPPPPSSGNAAAPSSGGYAGLAHSASAPSMGWSSSPGGAYANPYAGGSRHLASSRRYVAVDPVTGQALASSGATPPTSGSYYGSMTPTPPQSASASFTVFMPGSASSSSTAVSSPAAAAAALPSPSPQSFSSSFPSTRQTSIPENYQDTSYSTHQSFQQQPQPSPMYQPPQQAFAQPTASYPPTSHPPGAPDALPSPSRGGTAGLSFSNVSGSSSATSPGGQLFGSVRGSSTDSAERLFASIPPPAASPTATAPITAAAESKPPSVQTRFPAPPVLSASKFPLPPHMQRAALLQQAQQEPPQSHPTSVASDIAPEPSAADMFASSAAPTGSPPASETATAVPPSDGTCAASTGVPAQARPEASGGRSIGEEEAPAPHTHKDQEEKEDDDVDDGMLDDIPLSPEPANKPTIGAAAGSGAAPVSSDFPPPPAAS